MPKTYVTFRELITTIQNCRTIKPKAKDYILNMIYGIGSDTVLRFTAADVSKMFSLERSAPDKFFDVSRTNKELADNLKNICDALLIRKETPLLRQAVKNAVNIQDNDKKKYLKQNDDYLFIVTVLDAILQKKLPDDLAENYFAFICTNDSNDEQTYLNAKHSLIYNQLVAISNDIYDSLLKQEARYHLKEGIQPSLLSSGTLFSAQGISNGEKKSLEEFFESSNNNLYIEGDGGIGKTSFLLHLYTIYKCKDNEINKYIPIYLPLYRLKDYLGNLGPVNKSSNTIITALINTMRDIRMSGKCADIPFIESDFISDLTEVLNGNKEEIPTILLLLDGINEITLENNCRIRSMILAEIENLSNHANVRIVASSRSFEGNRNFHLHNETKIFACGITDEDLKEIFVEKKLAIPTDNSLFEILHIPLFLKMYIDISSVSPTNANTRGAILYQFFNGSSSLYCEKNATEEIKTMDSSVFPHINVVLDFILPAIAAHMVESDSFEIESEDFAVIFDSVELKNLSSPFYKKSNIINNPFSSYNKDFCASLENEIKAIIDPGLRSRIADELTSHLGILYKTINGTLSFTHQYIRDYFAALYKLIAFCCYDYYPEFYYSLIQRLYPETVSLLADDILKFNPRFGMDNLLKGVLNHLSGHDLYVITPAENILKQLSLYYNDDLSQLTFENFDFRSINMSHYKFYNFGTKKSATFKNCSFSEASFLSYNGFNEILRTIVFYNERPCILEVEILQTDYIIIDEVHSLLENAIIRVIDLSSKSIIMSYPVNVTSTDMLYEMFVCKKIVASPEMTGIILYGNPSGYLFVCSSYSSTFKEIWTKEPVVKFISEEEFIVISDNKSVYKYDITKLNNPIVGKINYDDVPPFDDDYSVNSIDYANIQIADNGWVIIQIPIDYLNCSIYVYDIKDNSTTYIPLDTVSLYSENYEIEKPSNGDSFFSTNENILYLIDEDTIHAYEKKEDSFIEIWRYVDDKLLFDNIIYVNNNLYVLVENEFFIFDEKSMGLIDKIGVDIPFGAFFYSDQYIVRLESTNSMSTFWILNLKTNQTIFKEYGSLTMHDKVIRLQNDKLLFAYSTGFAAITDKLTLDFEDCFWFPKGINTKQIAYNRAKNHLGLIYDCPEDKTPYLSIYDCSNGNLLFSANFMYERFSFTNDGKFMLALCMKDQNLYLFSTDDYSVVDMVYFNGYMKDITQIDDTIYILAGPTFIKPYMNTPYYMCECKIDEKKGHISGELYGLPFGPLSCNLSNYIISDVETNQFYRIISSDNSPVMLDIMAPHIDFKTKKDLGYKTLLGKKAIYASHSTIMSRLHNINNYDDTDIIVECNEDLLTIIDRHNPSVSYKIDGMTANANSFLDREKHLYYSNDTQLIYTAKNVDYNRVDAQVRFDIGLTINKCKFVSCHFTDVGTAERIKNNGGIIED